MSYPDQFQLSKEVTPQGGYQLSRSECGFILAELEEIVAKYKKEIEDENMSRHLKNMCEHHLEGLEYITENVRKGMTNRGENQ